MKKENQGLEALSVKRSKVEGADKVRYRVYRAPDDFIAVIAESALMAMKISGIATPYRIVRDLPTEGIAIEAQKMSKIAEPERVKMATEQRPREAMKVEMVEKAVPLDSGFVPMDLGDLKKKKSSWARVLTPEMVEGLRAKQAAPAAKVEPVVEAPPPPPAPLAPEPEPEVAPPPAPEPVADAAPAESEVLSEEEVQKLLNS